jgi:hypothetical protein
VIVATESRPAERDLIDDNVSDVIATPEGDNEMLPDQPLEPTADAAVTGLETPRGSEPDSYKIDKG